MISIKAIENIVDQYTSSLNDYKDPIITKYQITKICNDLIDLKLNLNNYKSNKKYATINDKLNNLQFKIDQETYKVNASSKPQEIVNEIIVEQSPSPHIAKSEDINELKQRLLSGSTTMLDKSNNVNEYHENIQEEAINDISKMVTDLKNGAIKFSMSLIEDEKLVKTTEEKLLLNENFMNVVGNNLNSYVSNKTGGKISFWYLLKSGVALVLIMIIMVIIIRIFPKM